MISFSKLEDLYVRKGIQAGIDELSRIEDGRTLSPTSNEVQFAGLEFIRDNYMSSRNGVVYTPEFEDLMRTVMTKIKGTQNPHVVDKALRELLDELTEE